MSEEKNLLEVSHLKQYFPVHQGFKTIPLKAVDDISFAIKPGETLGLVGESGCGKTTVGRTLLRLYQPTAGRIVFDGKVLFDSGEQYDENGRLIVDANGKPVLGKKVDVDMLPYRRQMQMVFQDPYSSLNPRMTVEDIIGEPLDVHKLYANKKERREKILNLMELVGLNAEHAMRYAHEFSGGQRQRVALARAMVKNPKVFLMDEPLSNLDAKLRTSMRTEIIKLHKKLATTFIYVTHDQTEAMTMGDRIVVMKDGIIQQVDTPQNLYDMPCNMFVAGFIGSPQMNFLDGTLIKKGDLYGIDLGGDVIPLPKEKTADGKLDSYVGKKIKMGIRPEDIDDEPEFMAKHTDCQLDAKVDVSEMMGAEIYLYLEYKGNKMTARVAPTSKARNGDTVRVAFDPHKVHLFDIETEQTILN